MIALIRCIYEGRFRRLGVHYEDSILSYIYPNLIFAPYKITLFLKEIGKKRNTIKEFMLNNMGDVDRFILFDGHRIISAANNMDNAELGYDSKRRYKPQINLVYLFTLGTNTGYPVYYKQFIGSTPDVKAFLIFLKKLQNTAKTVLSLLIKDLLPMKTLIYWKIPILNILFLSVAGIYIQKEI